MAYYTKGYSLEFWGRLLNRLEAEFAAGDALLQSLMTPLPASVDSLPLAQAQADANRALVYEALSRLELVQVLLVAVTLGHQDKLAEVGIPQLELQLAARRQIANLFGRHMCGLPRRTLVEQDLHIANERFNALRSAGQGDSINLERQRMRAITRDILVVGQEDAAGYETATRRLQTEIDELDSELQALRVGTVLALELPDEQAAALAEFGVLVYPVRDQELPTAPAGQAETISAAGAEEAETSLTDTPA